MDAEPQSSEPSAAEKPSRWKHAVKVLVGILAVYFVVTYVIVPQVWKGYAQHHPSFDDSPRITKTRDDHPGDPLNVALVGTEEQVKQAMLGAGWFAADALGLKSDVRIGVDTVLKKSYAAAPVSSLFLFGRKEDLAFEQSVGDDPRHRHHVRFWKTEKVDDGRPVWIGSAAYDERVGLSHTTGQITHHISGDIDAERDYVIHSLEKAHELAEMYKVPGFHKDLEGRNGGGDAWHTDGTLWVGVIAVQK